MAAEIVGVLPVGYVYRCPVTIRWAGGSHFLDGYVVWASNHLPVGTFIPSGAASQQEGRSDGR